MFSYFSKSKRALPAEQHTPSSLRDRNQKADGRDDKPLEQYVLEKAPEAILEAEAIFHLGTENLSNRVSKQVLFGDASKMHIKGEFFGVGSQSVASQIASNHLERQMAKDSAMMTLEMRRQELAERRLQFEMRMHQPMFLEFLIGADVESRRERTFYEKKIKCYIRSEAIILPTSVCAYCWMQKK
jgi:hypothetical protein